jgi:hypothetical protein
MYPDGLARFATMKYKVARKKASGNGRKSGIDKFMHLTNYSVNKGSDNFKPATAENGDEVGASKQSIKSVMAQLAALGFDADQIMTDIKDVSVKTIIAAEPSVAHRMQALRLHSKQCFELYGLDMLIQNNSKVWLLEVNNYCSLASSSPLDKSIKMGMMADLFHLAGFTVPAPPSSKQAPEDEKTHGIDLLSMADPVLVTLAEFERQKETRFERLFPVATSVEEYLSFLETPIR